MVSDMRKDRFYSFVIASAKGVFRLLGLRFTIRGTEHIPRTGAAILVSNHVSYLDFTFCGLAANPQKRFVRFMAKQAVFSNKISGPMMRAMHHIPVDRQAGTASYNHAIDELKAGEIVGIFPEATISRSFQLKDFKSGVVRMAIDAQVPLIPMITWGGQRIATKDGRRSFKRGKSVMIIVGEPIPPTDRRQIRALMSTLRASMEDLLAKTQAEYPDRPSGPDDSWWLPKDLGGTAPTLEEAKKLDLLDAEGRRKALGAEQAGKAIEPEQPDA